MSLEIQKEDMTRQKLVYNLAAMITLTTESTEEVPVFEACVQKQWVDED